MRAKDSSMLILGSGTNGGARTRAPAVAHEDRPRSGEVRALESLRLARTELEGQLAATTNERRRDHINQAIAEIERRMKEAEEER